SVPGATGDAANYSNRLLIAAGTALLGLIVFFVFKKKIYEGNHALETEESAK
ncbi:MAG: MFS transporter, partial [Bifidobacterium adolescentis]